MKKIYLLLMLSFGALIGYGQATGDIAFIGFNSDGQDDFAIVTLVDIQANTTIYFSDNESDGLGGLNTGEGTLEWNSGNSILNAGTIVVFSDVRSPSSVSFGTVTAVSGEMNFSNAGDALFAYVGTDASNPTTFLSGVQSAAAKEGDLAGSGLVEGSTFVTFSNLSRGGFYNGARNTASSFSDYLVLIGNPSNWTAELSNGELVLPFDETIFSLAGVELVGFDEPSNSVSETDNSFEFLIPVSLSNYGGSQVDLSVSISGGSADPADYTLNTNSLSFTSDGSINISIDINDDADDMSETIEITLAETTFTGIQIAPSLFTLTINDDDTAPLVITEINYNPTVGSDNNFEFIEIYNAGSSTVDLNGYTLSESFEGSFTTGDQIAAGEYILVTIDAASYTSTGGQVFEWTSGGMQNGGETIVLKNSSGAIVDQVTYDPSIIVAANGTGPSLSLIDVTADNSNMMYWIGSGTLNGTPGVANNDITVWTSIESTDWLSQGNWSNGAPAAGISAVILSGGSSPIIADDVEVASLKVGVGVSYTVTTGTVVINDELILDGSATIASGSAFAILGTASGAGVLTVHRNTAGSDGYSVVGAPVVGATLDGLVSQGATHILDSDGATFTPLTSGDMVPGKGYFVAQVGASNPSISFTGSLVSGNITAPVAANGFSLLANPYTASVSAAAVIASDATNQVTTGSIYVWDDGGSNNGGNRVGTYRVVNNIGTADFSNIGSVQGFFVQANTGGDITFTPDMQVTTAGANADGNFYRKASDEKQILKLAITGNGLHHETVLGFLEDATFGRDYGLDAQYLKGNEFISFYSMIENVKFATQGLPLLNADPIEVALGMDLAEAGTYSILVEEFAGFSNDLVVTLMDLETGQSYELASNFEMSFSTGAVANANRFKVVVSPARALSVDNLANKLQVLGGTSELTINYASNKAELVNIFSLDGRSVFSGEVTFKNNQAVIQPRIIENQVYLLNINNQAIKFIIK